MPRWGDLGLVAGKKTTSNGGEEVFERPIWQGVGTLLA